MILSFLLSRQGQRDFVTYYADEIMVQRELSQEGMFWIIEQSLKTPPYIASALFASGMFTNNMAEAKLVDETLPALSIIAEHWANTAVMQKHFPKTRTAVLGGAYDVLGASREVQPDPGRFHRFGPVELDSLCHSWIPSHIEGWNAALIFDKSYRPKPAYYSLWDGLAGR